MEYGPYVSAVYKTERDADPNRTYACHLWRPHLLALAIADKFPALSNRYAVNIGASDGVSCNDPVYPLYQAGYTGLAIEGGDFPDLFVNVPNPAVTKMINQFVTPDNVAGLLAGAGCPRDPDFLKLDIDGYDGPVLAAILAAGYRPKVMQVEVNPEFPPPVQFAVAYDPGFQPVTPEGHVTGFYGCSVAYAMALGQRYHYRMAYLDFVTDYTHDAVLVHSDYAMVAEALFGPEIRTKPLRDWFLSHPPGYSHFAEDGISTKGWRYRTDYHALLTDIRTAVDEANALKHGDAPNPYHLSL